jgi:hypothetical protein
MPGNNPRVNPLESRKQLLIAESELNRAQMAGEMASLTAAVRTLAGRAKTFGSIASAVALVVAGVSAFRRGKSVFAGAKPSWLQTLFKSSSLISSLWLAFRSRGQEKRKDDKREERTEKIRR